MARWAAMRVAAVVTGTVNLLILGTLPAIVDVLAKYLDLKAAALGTYGSADVAGITVGSLVGIPLMRASSPRTAVVLGLTSLMAADLGSAAVSTAASLIALRAAGGIGTGLSLAASYYVYGLEHQERNYAACTLGQTGLAFVVMMAIPSLADSFGWRAPFVCLAALVLPGLMLARHFPVQPTVASPKETNGVRPQNPVGLLSLGIASITAFFMGQGGLWTYLGQIGVAKGFSGAFVATSLSICAAVGFLSSIVVLALGPRVTARIALAGSVAVNLVAAFAATTRVPLIYALALALYYAPLPFIATGLFGAITRLPSPGRAAAYASTATFAGYTIGPVSAGLIAEHLGFGAVRWVDIVFVGLAGVLVWPLLARQRETADAASDPGCT